MSTIWWMSLRSIGSPPANDTMRPSPAPMQTQVKPAKALRLRKTPSTNKASDDSRPRLSPVVTMPRSRLLTRILVMSSDETSATASSVSGSRSNRVLLAAPGGVRPDRTTRALLSRIATTAPEVPRELVFVRHAGQPTDGTCVDDVHLIFNRPRVSAVADSQETLPIVGIARNGEDRRTLVRRRADQLPLAPYASLTLRSR